ncbi:unnamed protein product [Clonostachys rosea f. rosea IK726]|uniref:Rhodopsin domain-containing protein n=2 Tax=Bionectria ochroleuca TaxID=29856 RepID=A0A0B7KRY9_BIOOC|nr:unnamed protein product [Clonostachys rosea f. rosea IK726]
MAGLQTNVFVGFGIVWTLSVLAIIGRVIARRMTKIRWWYEDYFCLCAFIFACAHNALCIYWCARWSLGQIIPDDIDLALHDEILYHSRKLGFFVSISYTCSLGASKLAILSLYWRLFQYSSIRIPIMVLFVVSIAWLVMRIFMTVFRCTPVPAYWDDSLGGSCNIKDSAFFFGTIMSHFFIDVIILSLPVAEVFKLHLPLAQKFAVAALFLLGIVVCVASVNCLILSITADAHTTQMPYDYALNETWGGVEVNIAIVSSCFPLLRPIFRSVISSHVLNSYLDTYTTNATSHAHRTYTCADGVEMMTLSKRRTRTNKSRLGGVSLIADEEKGILGDPTACLDLKTPEPVHTTTTTMAAAMRHGSGCEWFDVHDEDDIRVQSDVVVEVHEVKRPVSFGSDGIS